MISSPVDMLFSVVSAPFFLFVGHGVGQNAILVFDRTGQGALMQQSGFLDRICRTW